MIVGFHQRECMYGNKKRDMVLNRKKINPLPLLCLIFVVIGHYTINIPMCHPMCCLTATSKSAKAFKHSIFIQRKENSLKID